VLYWEAHITLDPVLEKKEKHELEMLAEDYGFRVAKLYLEKEESKKDAFMTGRSNSYEPLERKVKNLVEELKKNKYTVRRYKIEAAVLDVRS
jgi:hypothetical protein